MDLEDVLRELDKIATALERAGEHLSKQNEANAALHLSTKVLYSPLTVSVLDAHESAVLVRGYLKMQADQ